MAHRSFLNKTVHAGEAYGPESIFEAITDLHAERIGHGCNLFRWDLIGTGEGRGGRKVGGRRGDRRGGGGRKKMSGEDDDNYMSDDQKRAYVENLTMHLGVSIGSSVKYPP